MYWDLTQRTYREEVDPSYDSTLEAGLPFCASGVPFCDADYVYADRPLAVRDAVAEISLRGDLDALLPIRTNSDPYVDLIRKAGRSHLHRYYVVQGGNHVDQLYDVFPDRLRPIAPCYREAFMALERWVEIRGNQQPVASKTIARPTSGDVANQCPL